MGRRLIYPPTGNIKEENAFESVVCETAAILSRPQCVNYNALYHLDGGFVSHDKNNQGSTPFGYNRDRSSTVIPNTTRPSYHHDDVIMGAMASQITSPTIVYSTVYSGADQRKHQSSASLAFAWGILWGPVNSSHKWPVTGKMFPFDDVIMY